MSGILVPDDWTLVPRAHYHPLARFDGANNRREFRYMNVYSSMRRSKDNIINTGSTNNNHPTKRLDKVDSTTGRIININ